MNTLKLLIYLHRLFPHLDHKQASIRVLSVIKNLNSTDIYKRKRLING